MKANIKAILKRGLGILLVSGMLTACNDDKFFLLDDRNGLGSEVVWNSEGSINFHLNKTYELIIPKWPHQVIPNRWEIHLASDENYFASESGHAARALGINGEPLNNHDVFYVGNIYTLNYGNNRYLDIARCNNAIKFIPESTISEEAKRRFLGQYHAMRAMVYLELVKVYGGTTLVLEPQDPSNLQAKGRASARECFNVIIDDLTKAVDYLDGVTYANTEWGHLTQEAAASLKAKALFYWASPQFNPVNDSKHPYDASRWETALAANKAAYDLCIAKGHSLVPNYAQIWQTKGSANKETIISRSYSSSLPKRGHNEERKNRPQSATGAPDKAYRATWKLLQAYPMKDGNRIDQAGTYTYDAVMFWQNRDPRFTATYAHNGSLYPFNGDSTRFQWTYVGAVVKGVPEGANWGVYTKKFTTLNLPAANVPLANDVGGSGMDWIEMRLAEVMLNYADCANETGDMATAKNMVRLIRQRAGVEIGSNDYGLGSLASIADMRDLILNERMIEFAFENKRNSDLRRTRRWHLLSGESLETIRIELQDGVTAKDLNGGQRDSTKVNDKTWYQARFRMAIQQQNNGFTAMNIPEYHNFYTFHNDYVWRGVDIYPTIGWAGGTFDPLDN